jgi:hypothetical protein
MFVIAGMGLQERLALKAALNFMVRRAVKKKNVSNNNIIIIG